MNFKPDVVGRGYLQACLRVENRPGSPPRPEDKDEILERLDAFHAASVPAWWYSVSAKGSHPLFPSKVLPHHPDAVPGMYEWLSEEVHKRDMVLCSWEYLCTAPYLIREHPDYAMQFLEPKTPPDWTEDALRRARERHEKAYGDVNPVACYLSPYGDLLKEFCVEVFEDLGFDAIWFDGCFMNATNTTPGKPKGCCCPRCAAKFRADTGQTIPRVEDWDDPDFRTFIKWRYAVLGDYMQSLCRHVRAKSKHGLVCLNHFQRIYNATGGGCPLNPLDVDGLVTAEIDQAPYQAIMQLKYLRAISNRHTQELWIHQQPNGPNADPSDMAYFGMLCMTGGGHMALGLSSQPKDAVSTLSGIVERLGPRAPYVGGEPFRYAGIVLSSSTKDFASAGDDEPTWRSVHGIHNILMHAHLPSEIILDDQVTPEHLRTCPLVILSDVRCLSDEQAEHLADYVDGGGLLLATAATGMLDEMGWERERGALDDLMGVVSRDAASAAPSTIRPIGDWGLGLAACLDLDGFRYGQPEDAYEDPLWVEFQRDVTALAEGEDEASPPAITVRQVGQGHVIFINRDIGGFYSRTPSRQYREVVAALLLAYREPPYEVDAMPHVAVTAWRQEAGQTHIHVLSQIHELCYLPATVGRPHLDMGSAPPSGPVRIRLPWQVQRAECPVSGEPVSLCVEGDGSTIAFDGVDQHDVIVVD